MSKWRKIYLKQIGFSQTGPFGSQLHEKDYVEIGTPIVTVEHLGGYKFTTQNLPFVSDYDKNRLSKYILEEGDIVFSRVGSIDRSTYVSKDEAGWLFSGRCLRVRINKETAYPKFISYYFKQEFFKKMMLDISVGATMPSLNTKLMDNIPLFLPQNINIQQRIASILSSLDDKIELNNRINAELEAIAKTLYDYWFVQFDFPDADGKPYKSSGGKMVYNEELKREIPKGWVVNELKEHISIERGISYKGNEISSAGIPMINLNSFYLNGSYKQEGLKYFTGKYNRTISPFDLVIATTDVTRNADIIGKSFIVPNIFDGDIILSCDIAKITISDSLDKYYLEKLFNSDYYHNYIKGFASGTLVLHLNTDGIDWYKIAVPPKRVLVQYSKLRESIEKKKNEIIIENQRLASLRDWLLPMLMNGQVGFKEAYKEQTQTVSVAAEAKVEYKPTTKNDKFQVGLKEEKKEQTQIINLPQQQDLRFELWLSNQGLAARGEIDKETLREIFNVMDEEEYGK